MKILIIPSQTMKYWGFIKENVLHNFMKYFSGAQVNQIVNKYLNL